MTFNELQDLVSTVAYAPWNSEVRLGCDCGCGGDRYTTEEWKEEARQVDEATETLKKMGITFDD